MRNIPELVTAGLGAPGGPLLGESAMGAPDFARPDDERTYRIRPYGSASLVQLSVQRRGRNRLLIRDALELLTAVQIRCVAGCCGIDALSSGLKIFRRPERI
jgi:hypothetical protein